MSRTRIGTSQILPDGLMRDNINVDKPGQAIITKVLPGSGLKLTNTGCDVGTGDVTISISSFTYIQNNESPSWMINHNLNKLMPLIIVCDSEGNEVEGDIKFINQNTCELTFNPPIKGQAYLA